MSSATRLAVTVAVLLGLASIGNTGSAYAQVTPAESRVGTTLSRPYVEARLDPAAVAYYVERYEVSEAEARRRLTDQNLVLNLPAALGDRLEGRVGSVWFDNDAGHWVVPVTDPRREETAKQALRDFGLEAGARVTRGAATVAELRQRGHRLASTIQRMAGRNRASLSIARNAFDAEISSSLSSSERARIEDAVRDEANSGTQIPYSVVVRSDDIRNPQAAISCVESPARRCDTLIGGIRWTTAFGGVCTLGFPVFGNGTYDRYNVTAGHCHSGSGSSWSACKPTSCPGPAGNQMNIYLGGASQGDGMLLQLTVGFWASYGGWHNWSVNTNTPSRYVYNWNPSRSDSGNAPVGLVVCKNGQTTGTSCGTITNNLDPGYTQGGSGAWLARQLQIDGMCALPGDSGGPVTAAMSETAVGLASSSNFIQTAGVAPQCHPSPRLWAEPVGRALYMTGTYIYYG